MIYLASPYTHCNPAIQADRAEEAAEATARLILDGYHVYSPIAYTHPIVEAAAGRINPYIQELAKKPSGFWYKFDKDMMRRCERVIILAIPGWRESKGTFIEVDYYIGRGMYWGLLTMEQVRAKTHLFVSWYKGGKDKMAKRAEELGV